MNKKTDSLVFKFAVIFAIFTLVTVTISGIHTYNVQTDSYREQAKNSITGIATYLESMMQADAHNFKRLQEWWIKHVDTVHIPLDFDGNSGPARLEFERQFTDKYPGKTFDVDISFEQVDFETQKAWAIWFYELWLANFESARTAFNVPYTYYTFPHGEDQHLFWMIDALREPFENPTPEQEGMIDLTDDYYDSHLYDYPNAERIWNSGKQTFEYDIYDNEYGKTYAYCVPFIVDGRILGLIGVDVEIATVNKEILKVALITVGGQSSILLIAVLFVLLFIYRTYIQKLIHLQFSVVKYTHRKDPSIAAEIEQIKSGNDEITVLSSQIGAMILEIENYINNLFQTTEKLKTTEALAKEMNELAIKDPLTGIRNKTAYDREVTRLTNQIRQGQTDFGIAMIDLNYLKRLNDTYGHEQGNKAIRRLSKIICQIFTHSPVFRIGGDEFVVILENHDFNNINSLYAEFIHAMEEEKTKTESKPWESVSAAIGIAVFESGRDRTVQNVFDRADKTMYNFKRAMKANRT